MNATRQKEKAARQMVADLKRGDRYKALPGLDRPSPRGFTEYRDLAAYLLGQELGAPYAMGAASAAAFGCCHALHIEAPLLHLGRDLAAAFLATAAPPMADQIRSPFPAFILNLPHGLLRSDEGEQVLAIVVSHIPDVCEWINGNLAISDYQSREYYRLQVTSHKADFTVTGLLSTSAIEFLNISTAELVEAANRNMEAIEAPPTQAQALKWGYGPSEIAPELARLAINAILCLQHRPELQTDELAQGRLRGFGMGSSYRGSIRWLGRDYRRRCDGPSTAAGTGTGKAPHWRRGHWHNVVHGAGRAMRRLQWFQPVYVNSTTEREVA